MAKKRTTTPKLDLLNPNSPASSLRAKHRRIIARRLEKRRGLSVKANARNLMKHRLRHTGAKARNLQSTARVSTDPRDLQSIDILRVDDNV